MRNVVKENINLREEKPYYIYIHTCPNSMVYVGKTKNPKTRWKNGEGYKEYNKQFYKAIQTYGWENIKHEIVAKTYYGWMARKMEKVVISRYKKYGKAYNMVNDDKPGYISQRKIPLKRVGKFSKDGELIKEYDSATEAWRDGNPVPGYIQKCCRGEREQVKGYIWKYL